MLSNNYKLYSSNTFLKKWLVNIITLKHTVIWIPKLFNFSLQTLNSKDKHNWFNH